MVACKTEVADLLWIFLLELETPNSVSAGARLSVSFRALGMYVERVTKQMSACYSQAGAEVLEPEICGVAPPLGHIDQTID